MVIATGGPRELNAEDTGNCEHAHETSQVRKLGLVDPSFCGYLTESGGATVVVDGVGDAEVYSGFECHGLDIAQGMVPEIVLSIQQGLIFGAWGERYDAVLLLFLFVIWEIR